MTLLSLKPKHPVVTALAIVVALPTIVMGAGFLFHTDFDPDVLGKYTWSYLTFLVLWWVLAVPLSYLFGRFVFGTQTVKLSGGREALVRPRLKILWLLGLGVPLVLVGLRTVENRLKKTTATVHTDDFHPYLQNTPRPGRGTYQINRWGFRGAEIEKDKPEGTVRVFMLGGSTAFCGNLNYEDTHCGLMEAALRRRYPDVNIEVQNASTDWHTSQHSLIKLLTYLPQFDPDIIIVFHGINDLLRSLTPEAFSEGRYRADYGHYDGAVANYVRPSSTLQTVFGMYLGYWFSDFRADRVRVLGPDGDGVKGTRILFFPRAEEAGPRNWKSLPEFDRNMTNIVKFAQDRGIDVVMASQGSLYRRDLSPEEGEVIWFPHSHHFNGKRPAIPAMVRGMAAVNEVSARLATEANVPFVDLDSMLPRTLEYFYDDVHYTRSANQTIADAWVEAIVEAELIEGRVGEGANGN